MVRAALLFSWLAGCRWLRINGSPPSQLQANEGPDVVAEFADSEVANTDDRDAMMMMQLDAVHVTSSSSHDPVVDAYAAWETANQSVEAGQMQLVQAQNQQQVAQVALEQAEDSGDPTMVDAAMQMLTDANDMVMVANTVLNDAIVLAAAAQSAYYMAVQEAATTDSPTGSPTTSPTGSPTVSPTLAPTGSPTGSPTTSPTGSPTVSPTLAPTGSPTGSPTTSPTGSPTVSPTLAPTGSPTGSPTTSPTSSPTVSPTPAPTGSPTGSPTTSPTLDVASGTGDPHLSNVRGDHFDVYQTGHLSLLRLPRSAEPPRALLFVEADAERVGDLCSVYFQAVTISGVWTNQTKPMQFLAKPGGTPEGRKWREWMRFGPIDLKVTLRKKGVEYLNVYARNVARTEYEVGGLLGLDDHTAVATRPRECAHRHAATLLSSSVADAV